MLTRQRARCPPSPPPQSDVPRIESLSRPTFRISARTFQFFASNRGVESHYSSRSVLVSRDRFARASNSTTTMTRNCDLPSKARPVETAREGLEPISTVRLRARVTHTYVHRWHVLDSRSMCMPPPRSAREFRPQLHFARPCKRAPALAELLLYRPSVPARLSCAVEFTTRVKNYSRVRLAPRVV